MNLMQDPELMRLAGGAAAMPAMQSSMLLGGPQFVANMARQGMSVPAYAYALNNPVAFIDDNGLGPKKGGQYDFPPAGSPFENNPPAGWGGPLPPPSPKNENSCSSGDKNCTGVAFAFYAGCIAKYPNSTKLCAVGAAVAWATCMKLNPGKPPPYPSGQ